MNSKQHLELEVKRAIDAVFEEKKIAALISKRMFVCTLSTKPHITFLTAAAIINKNIYLIELHCLYMTPENDPECWAEKEIKRIFEEKQRLIGTNAKLEISFIDDASVIGSFVFGEAFPFENPPRVWLEVVAGDATSEELTKVICDELIHIKHPSLEQYGPGAMDEREEFTKLLQTYL